jgi:hypothetical protein
MGSVLSCKFSYMVRGAGLEPAQYCYRQDLNPKSSTPHLISFRGEIEKFIEFSPLSQTFSQTRATISSDSTADLGNPRF